MSVMQCNAIPTLVFARSLPLINAIGVTAPASSPSLDRTGPPWIAGIRRVFA
jgi:hypothetical protein